MSSAQSRQGEPRRQREPGHPRNKTVDALKAEELKLWKLINNCHLRSLSESAMYRDKQLISAKLSLRDYNGQVGEALAGVKALNKVIRLGMPVRPTIFFRKGKTSKKLGLERPRICYLTLGFMFTIAITNIALRKQSSLPSTTGIELFPGIYPPSTSLHYCPFISFNRSVWNRN